MAAVDPQLAAERAVSLPALLTSRECRQARQQAWLAQHECTLLVLTLVVPGPVKDSADARHLQPGVDGAAAAVRRTGLAQPAGRGAGALHRLRRVCRAARRCPAGEGLRHAAGGEPPDRPAVGYRRAGYAGRILSRRDIGLPERRCLLCGQPAKICARQRHSSSCCMKWKGCSTMRSLPINLPAHRAEPACDFARAAFRALLVEVNLTPAGAGGSP